MKVRRYQSLGYLFCTLLVVGVISVDLHARTEDDTSKIEAAFKAKKSDLQVRAKGKVIKVLPDDNEGSRHQRFIVKLRNKQTLLIAHNIDLAPRVAGLKVGDIIEFYGEYEWNDKGGVIHWTHKDPGGRHVHGWIKRNGKKFQ